MAKISSLKVRTFKEPEFTGVGTSSRDAPNTTKLYTIPCSGLRGVELTKR